MMAPTISGPVAGERASEERHACAFRIAAAQLTNPEELDRKIIQTDYERHLALMTQSGAPLALDDLREFIAESTAAGSAVA